MDSGELSIVLAPFVESPMRFLGTSAFSLAAAFAVYPLLKSFIGRTRPCEYDPSLVRVAPIQAPGCGSDSAAASSADPASRIAAATSSMPATE